MIDYDQAQVVYILCRLWRTKNKAEISRKN